MTPKDEALKLALEALELYYDLHEEQSDAKAITAIREALAEQPAQQQAPVAWTDLWKKADEIVRGKILWKRFIDGTPLANDIAVWMADFAQQHTSPPPRKPLTDEEIVTMYDENPRSDSEMIAFARVIEAAHGIKGEA